MFLKNKLRLIAASSALVLLLAGGAFFVIKHYIKDDTIKPPTNVTPVLHKNSTGADQAVDSNAAPLNATDSTDPKVIIENKMVEVRRIANACKTYAGINKVHLVRGAAFADDNPYPLNRSALFSGNAPICDTTGLTGSQLTEATGNYPALDTYSYYLGGDYTFPADGLVIIEDVAANSEDTTLKCTFRGCTKGTDW